MIYVVLPIYNEADNITQQLEAIDVLLRQVEVPYHVIAVNDGSRDGSLGALEALQQRLPVTIVTHEVNRGVGEAFRSGFRELFKRLEDDDVVITMDADNTQNLRSMRMILQKIDGGYDVVVGSCYGRSGGRLIGVPWQRHVMSWLSNALYRTVFPIQGVSTYTGFFRGYRGAALKHLAHLNGEGLIAAPGFTAMAELLLELRRMPLFIIEIPMIVHYNKKAGASKLRVLPTIREHLRLVRRFMLSRVRTETAIPEAVPELMGKHR